MSRAKPKRAGWLSVGARVIVPFPGARIPAEVIEDRGGLGVGGRQIVRVRTLEETVFPREMEFPVALLEVPDP